MKHKFNTIQLLKYDHDLCVDNKTVMFILLYFRVNYRVKLIAV